LSAELSKTHSDCFFGDFAYWDSLFLGTGLGKSITKVEHHTNCRAPVEYPVCYSYIGWKV